MEGYITIAVGERMYIEMALNLALSIRSKDSRPICLLTDGNTVISENISGHFDYIVRIADCDLQVGAMNKVNLIKYSPFDRSLYMDSDCLVVKDDLDKQWKRFSQYPFGIEGYMIYEGMEYPAYVNGNLYQVDVDKVKSITGCEFISGFNGGVFFFDKSERSKEVFQLSLEYFNSPHRTVISYPYKRPGEYADEPFFAAAMGKLGIRPVSQKSRTEFLQVTTVNILDYQVNIGKGNFYAIKMIDDFGRTIDQKSAKPRIVSGTVCHFCGLQPGDLYIRLSNQLRLEVGLPLLAVRSE